MSSARSNRIRTIAAGALLAAALAAPVLACPLCNEETEARSEETGINVSMGYSVSVLLMLALPMAMVGGLGYALYRNQQQAAPGGNDRRLPPQ